MSEAPCPYVSTSSYDWKLYAIHDSPSGCSLLPWNPLVFCLDTAWQACTIWIGLSLNVQLFLRFKTRRSLYFWAMLVSIWGSLFFSVAVILQTLAVVHQTVSVVLLNVGWVAMVTGFSFILYSRLHLLKPRKIILKIILVIIIVDAILFHGPVIITTIILNVHPSKTAAHVFEITSFTEIAFSIQEMVLAAFYIYFFLQYAADWKGEPETDITLRLLIGAEVVVLSTDIVLNTLLYTRFYLARVMIQAFMTVLKLKIEFLVLNNLVDYTHSRSRTVSGISTGQTVSSGQTLTPGSSTNPVMLSLGRKFSEGPFPDDLYRGRSREMNRISSPTGQALMMPPGVLPDVV